MTEPTAEQIQALKDLDYTPEEPETLMPIIEAEIERMTQYMDGAENIVHKNAYTVLTEIIDDISDPHNDVPWSDSEVDHLKRVVGTYPYKACELVDKRIDGIRTELKQKAAQERAGLER